MMKKFTLHDMNGIRIIAVDNEAFDWGLEEENFKKVQLSAQDNPTIKDKFINDIQNHFLECFSEFLGRPTTFQEINKAIQEGWIV